LDILGIGHHAEKYPFPDEVWRRKGRTRSRKEKVMSARDLDVEEMGPHANPRKVVKPAEIPDQTRLYLTHSKVKPITNSIYLLAPRTTWLQAAH
jgi:hypothetical protein